METAPVEEFFHTLEESLCAAAFVGLRFTQYHGPEPELKSLHARKIRVKGVEMLSITYRYRTRDIVKNYPLSESAALLQSKWKEGFGAALLSTTLQDVTLERRKQSWHVKRADPSVTEAPSPDHDRAKQRLLETRGKPYLYALGITDSNGKVLPSAQDKYRQIDKYIEILSNHLKQLPAEKSLRIVDMGSGKGYLTFALYDYLTQTLGRNAEVTGVEYRQELVDLCNSIAQNSEFKGLRFVRGAIDAYDCEGADVVIALHACDTATDDAIAQAIRAHAQLIVVAPCCHKQIRKAMERGQADSNLQPLLKHGTLRERQAEMLTDSLRAELMEYFGYQTKLFEFISDAHTPKNVMLIGTQRKTPRDPSRLAAVQALKAHFGISEHYLERKLTVV